MVGGREGRALLGLGLDRTAEYLSWPADALDPYRLATQTQAIRVVAMVAAKAGVRRLDRDVLIPGEVARESGMMSPANPI
jgi:hypothetical protein